MEITNRVSVHVQKADMVDGEIDMHYHTSSIGNYLQIDMGRENTIFIDATLVQEFVNKLQQAMEEVEK